MFKYKDKILLLPIKDDTKTEVLNTYQCYVVYFIESERKKQAHVRINKCSVNKTVVSYQCFNGVSLNEREREIQHKTVLLSEVCTLVSSIFLHFQYYCYFIDDLVSSNVSNWIQR